MSPKLIILLAGLCWTYCHSTLAWQLCDNGKFQVELDLPHSSALLCTEPFLKVSSQPLHIDQKDPPPLQPAQQVCMDTPISYNAAIPSSGDHRPVGAEPGVYLYCPPQRWLNNLQHGSIVLLYHPCAPGWQRGRLAELAHSCLPGYIMTAHPWLSIHRPLALVVWGRTLEMSHVTAPEVCDWLVSVSSSLRHNSKPELRRREHYSLLLTHPAPLRRPDDTAQDTHATTSPIDWLKSLRRCCEQTLSQQQDGEAPEGGEDERIQRRERRAALGGREKAHQDGVKTELHTQPHNETDLHSTQSSKEESAVTPSAGMLVEAERPPAAVLAKDAPQPQTAAAEPSPPEEGKNQVGAAEPRKEDAPRTAEQGGRSQRGGVEEQKKEGGGGVEEQKKGGGGVVEEQKKGGGGGVEEEKVARTRSRVHSSSSSSSSSSRTHSHRKAGESGAASPRQRVREDTEEQRRLGEAERDTEPPAEADRALAVDRLPTPRTDEAVWAAAALGFLLVLLTLSVLHTRLYRHWRTMPSLYWRDSTQDYDSVTDVIRRRLKLVGRRKRRVAAGRRQEAPLIPNSSTEEESD